MGQPSIEQLPEIIHIHGVLHALYTMPLAQWLRMQKTSLIFDRRTPKCERGYIGRWAIEDNTLWLTGLYAWRNGEYTGVPHLFDNRESVAADWFSGALLVEPSAPAIKEGAYPGMSKLMIEEGRVIHSKGALRN